MIDMSKRIKSAMEARGFDRNQLAAATENTRRSVDFWMTGDRNPSAESIVKICAALNVSSDWLLGIKE